MRNSMMIFSILFAINSLPVEAIPVTLETHGTTYKTSLFYSPSPNPPKEGSDYTLTTTRTEEWTTIWKWLETELDDGFIIERKFFTASTELLPEYTKQQFIWDGFQETWVAGSVENGPKKSFRIGFEGFKDIIVKDIIVSVSEPSTFGIFCIGLAALLLKRKRTIKGVCNRNNGVVTRKKYSNPLLSFDY